MDEQQSMAVRCVLSQWGFHDLFTDSEQVDRMMADIERALGYAPMDDEKHTGVNFFVQAAAAMRESLGADATSEYVVYSKTDAKVTAAMMKALPGPITVTNFFEQAEASVPLFAEMCKRAKIADHDGYLMLELETDDSPEGKFITYVEAGDDLYTLLDEVAAQCGEGG